ncbi:glycosyltransferase [Microbacterium sp. NPDC096154]|uniref:glycosyltransferase n=1 Tax=Microbacterium sp. NPDC096154 TaxID=3155549 RepID=UPI00331C9350
MSADAPLLSIIIATFNAAAPLRETLLSLGSQKQIPANSVEIILQDGGSTDSTVRLARESGLFHSLTSEPDGGVYDAMNKGASRATGKWLQFLNAGDKFHSEWALAHTLSHLADLDGQAALWVIGRAVNTSLLDGRGVQIPSVPHNWVKHLLGVQPHCHQATWFRRDVFMAIGGHALDFGTAGDYDLIVRCGLLGRPAVIDTLIIDYEGGGMSAVGPKKTALLLHDVRVSRLELAGLYRKLDYAVTRVLALCNATRITLGRMRRGQQFHSAHDAARRA